MTTLAIIVLIMGLLGFALMMLGYLEKNQALTVSGLALAVIAVTFSTVDYLGNGVMFKQDKYITINQKTEACLQYLDDIVNGIPAGTSSRYDSTENQCIFQYPNSKELSSTSFETVRNHFASGEPSEREHQRELKKRFEDIGTGMIFAPSTEIKSTDVLSGAISKTTSSCVEYVVATE